MPGGAQGLRPGGLFLYHGYGPGQLAHRLSGARLAQVLPVLELAAGLAIAAVSAMPVTQAA